MEKKYIDAKAFLEYEIHQSGFQPDMQDRHGNYRLLKNELEQFPAADVVPVVRCKDCKHWNTEEKNLNGYCRCDVFQEWQYETDRPCFPPDGFCSKGQRRE